MLLQRYHDGILARNNKPQARGEIFQRVREAENGPALRPVYAAAFARWEANLPKELAAQAILKTDGRLIIGLGAQNVLETGLTLHHTYGTPIIPGSALKGLANHYAHSVWGEENPGFKRKGEYHNLLFGTTEDGGVIAFHDAWILPESLPTALQKDVMTPHHPDYQRDPAKDNKFRPPTDFDSPNPVSFLSVYGMFLLAVSWAGPVHPERAKWTNRAFELLCKALDEWGIGGKTSSGYGRLEYSDSKLVRWARIRVPGEPEKGEIVDAVLLDAPKPGKPWRAKLAALGLSGPIYPVDATPSDAVAGKLVRLRVSVFESPKIKFEWI